MRRRDGPERKQLNIFPNKPGVLNIKPSKYLAFNAAVDFTSGFVTGANVSVLPEDSNNDNSVDSSDFTALIGAFNSSIAVPGSGYDPKADFNGDGSVDSTDFTQLIGSFN